MAEGGDICGICKKARAVARCPGCGVPLCNDCACFDLFDSGCGTVIPVYYCSSCVRDPTANPNAIFWQMKEDDGSA